MSNPDLVIYIAGSFKHMHGVRLLGRELERLNCAILDWTDKASPPPGLTPAERRLWMDTDKDGGEVYKFCSAACKDADLVIYYGESGQDAGVEVGIAASANVPVLGIRGPLEQPGLMLHGAVSCWLANAEDVLPAVERLIRHKKEHWANLRSERQEHIRKIGELIRARER